MVTFDGINKLIIMDYGVTSLDVRLLYATWKQWVMLSDNLKYLTAFEVVGGNPTIGDSSITPYFFLVNGWKIRPYEGNHTLKVEGILLSTDESDIFVDTIGIFRIGIQAIVPLYAETTEVNSASIVYSSFQNAVWYDVDSSYDDIGTDSFPNGNTERPVNNIALAVQIAKDRGFRTIQVLSDLTLDTGDNVEEFELIGKSHVNTQLIVNSGADCLRTVFRSFNITGVLDGESDIFDCIVWDLEYFDGHIHDSMIAGVVTLSGAANATIRNCSSFNTAHPPVIDSSGSLQNLSMPNWSGVLYIRNVSQPVEIALGVDAGAVVLEPTCSSGTIKLSGLGELMDYSQNACYVRNSMIDGIVVNSLQRSIEYLRPHHTGSGHIYFWNPYDGHDDWDGLTVQTAVKTFAAAHALTKNANHDIIMAVSGNPSGLTVTNETITISNDYTFLRCPGRDFNIVSLDDNVPAITITGRGAEVSGLRVSGGLTSNVHAIETSGHFSLIKNVYVYESSNGILVSDGEYTILDNLNIHHGNGYGVKVGANTEHTDIHNCHIGSNAGDGVIVESGHEVNFINNVIHANTGYGINIISGSEGVVIRSCNDIFRNGSGDVLDNSTTTYRSVLATKTDVIVASQL